MSRRVPPLAHRQAEAFLEDDLQVRNVREPADAGDLRGGQLRRDEPLLDLFQPRPENRLPDGRVLVLAEAEVGEAARDAEMPHDVRR